MLKIFKEITQVPEMTFIKGSFNNVKFTLSYYLDGSYKIKGDIKEEDKRAIIDKWLMCEYV